MEDKKYGGMTIQERLFEAGLTDSFVQAAKRWDREAMISILKQVALTEEEAAWSVDTVLANPTKYGYY